MSSSSDDDAFNDFLASLRPKKKDKYQHSSGSLDSFIVEDGHISFMEDVVNSCDEDKNSPTNLGVLKDLELGFCNLRIFKEDDGVSAGTLNELRSNKDGYCSSRNGSHESMTKNQSNDCSDRKYSGRSDRERSFTPTSKKKQNPESSVREDVEEKKNKCLDDLNMLGSLTQKRSTANSRIKRMNKTPKIFFSSASDDSDNESDFADNTEKDMCRPTKDTLSKNPGKCKTPKKCSRIRLPTDSDAATRDDKSPFHFSGKYLSLLKGPETEVKIGESTVDKSAANLNKLPVSCNSFQKLSRILDFCDSEGSSPSPLKTTEKNWVSSEESHIAAGTSSDIVSDKTIPEFVGACLLPRTLDQNLPPSLPIQLGVMACVTSSGKKISRIPALSKDSSDAVSDFDNDEGSSPSPVKTTVSSEESHIAAGTSSSDIVSDKTTLEFVGTYPLPCTLDQNLPTSFPKQLGAMARVTSSAKKICRILVLSDDSSDADSDFDNDAICVSHWDEDKENVERNSFNPPKISPSEYISASDDCVNAPKASGKIKAIQYLDDDNYTPLVSRILGEKGIGNENIPRRTSEPERHKKLPTPARKPPKVCQTENSKSVKPVKSRSDGLPLGLPLNCEKGAGFKRNRDLLTKRLYDNFNETIFSNSLPKDMTIEWSKRLIKTAAVTKCTSQRVTSTESGMSCAVKTHSASISLSLKVLDNLNRLRDTLCHEMCHAAVWLVDLVNDGHGPYWKAWARKAMAAHPEMPMVKRCHSYDITCKFQYQCMICRKIYGRHSKSIKVDKQTCGVCRGKLILLPQINSDGTPAKSRTPNKFAMFVKENYKSTQRATFVGNATPKHSDVMKALSKQFASLSTQK